MILEPENSSNVEILFLKSGGHTVQFENSTFTFGEHRMSVSVGTPLQRHPAFFPLEPLEMGLMKNFGPTRFENVDGLLTRAEFLGDCEPTLRAGCSGPRALTSCRDDADRHLLAGRLTLSGGILRPGEVKDLGFDPDWSQDPLPPCPPNGMAGPVRQPEEESWAFHALDGQAVQSLPATKTFNGILYEVELAENTARLELGPNILEVWPEKSDLCGKLQTGLTECAYVRIDNSAEDAPGHVHLSAAQARKIDLHFALTYKVLEPTGPNCTPTIPVWGLRQDLQHPGCEPGGLGSRCVPPCACLNADKSKCNC